MKKSDLKRAIKPLVKECIHEVLIEEGLLSSVVAEVAKGLSASPIVEKRTQTKPKPPPQDDREMQRRNEDIKRKMQDHRKKLLEAVSQDAYNGVDLFEGTSPMSSYESSTPSQGAPDLGDPKNAGVDISSLTSNASQIWKEMSRK